MKTAFFFRKKEIAIVEKTTIEKISEKFLK